MEPETQPGAMTFLFTDIEGSTRLWEQHPQAMQVSLARHDSILKESIEAHRGRVVKTTGDGLFAAFPGALDGLHAALTAQRELAAEPWGETGPLRVRMGLHTGEAAIRQGDFFGPSLNRAARLMALASGGQVLLSAAVAGLVRDRLPPGSALRDLGEHCLKDLTYPEHIYQIAVPELPAEFPPLRSLSTFPNNLPVQLTSFIGRERELAEVKDLLSRARLLTLIGPGGSGKTRLSLQAAADLLEGFPGGVWLVELAPLSDPHLVVNTVAGAMGVYEQHGQPLLNALLDFLRDKTCLLILDNCEHLIDACARLAGRLLQSSPKLKVLASSREALGMAGETVYRVPSLPVPQAPAARLDEIAPYEAVRLFVERAQAALTGFTLTETNARSVAQITRRLDGIPLALELAAARVSFLKVDQIAARLDDRFRLLTGGSRTALPRQQTLRAAIDWSWELLRDAERTLLRRVSVFANSWTLEAAEAVVCDSAPGASRLVSGDLLDLVASLVNKSLLAVDRSGSEEARYRLLETIRQYGHERLVESGEAAPMRDRHLDFFLAGAEEAQQNLFGPDILVWRKWFDAELENCQAAMDWALDTNPVKAMHLAASFFSGPLQSSSASAAYVWLKASLAAADGILETEAGQRPDFQMARSMALTHLAATAFALGKLPEAIDIGEIGIQAARRIGDEHSLAMVLAMSGLARAQAGDLDIAAEYTEEALEISNRNGFLVEESLAIASSYFLATFGRRDIQKAREGHLRNLEIARRLDNPWILAMENLNLARINSYSGEVDQGYSGFKEAERLFLKIQDHHFVTVTRSELAHMLRRQKKDEEALAFYQITLENWRQYGNRPAAAHELECIAFISAARGEPERAACLLGAAEALRDEATSPMTAPERTEYDQTLSSLRSQMDAGELKRAWEQGRRMNMEEAVEYALG